MRRPYLLASAAGLAVLFTATSAWADLVLLLPAEGRVPGQALTSTLAHETRYAIVELGHNLVPDEEVTASVRQVADGRPDDANELGTIARNSGADWVVFPVIYSEMGAFRLEMTAYQSSTGRTEIVSRDIDTNVIHKQVVEMAKVLLSAQGVGTGALPWESAGPPPPMSSQPTDPATESTTTAPQPKDGASQEEPGSLRPLVGATLGVATALSRPEGATGSSTSMQAGLRAGAQLASPFEVALDLRSNLAGPKATEVDVSARYWIEAGGFRLAPELAPGVFFMGGGAQDTSFMLRATVVGAFDITENVAVEGHVGDVTWVPAEGGTVVLGGATAAGVVKF